jgi:hypothetical protein
MSRASEADLDRLAIALAKLLADWWRRRHDPDASDRERAGASPLEAGS